MVSKLRKFWKALGPGLITGASDDDPSAIAVYTIAGAHTGYSMLWTLLFSLPFMVAIQEMSARIGALSGCGLAGNIKRHYPAWLLVIVASVIVLANVFNVGANIYGMAGALNLLVPIPEQVLAVLLSVLILWMTIRLRYKQIVNVFKWLAMMLFAYVLAAFFINPDWFQILKHTLIPNWQIDKQFLVILFAVVGTTLSPYLYFWQASEEAEDIRQAHPLIRVCKFRAVRKGELQRIEWDTKLGMFFSNIISFFIVILAAATLYGGVHANVETLEQAAKALQPIAGEYAYILFSVGLIGSGLLAIPILAGSAAYVLAELFNWRGSLDDSYSKAREFYIVFTLAMIAGLAIPFVGITPVQALFWTAVLNGLIAPLLILVIIHMANNPKIVGPNVSSRVMNWLGHLAFLIMTAGAIFVIIS
ncbi:MAG: divalent metal cation transporter [Patescibacteria group bacterium]